MEYEVFTTFQFKTSVRAVSAKHARAKALAQIKEDVAYWGWPEPQGALALATGLDPAEQALVDNYLKGQRDGSIT